MRSTDNQEWKKRTLKRLMAVYRARLVKSWLAKLGLCKNPPSLESVSEALYELNIEYPWRWNCNRWHGKTPWGRKGARKRIRALENSKRYKREYWENLDSRTPPPVSSYPTCGE